MKQYIFILFYFILKIKLLKYSNIYLQFYISFPPRFDWIVIIFKDFSIIIQNFKN